MWDGRAGGVLSGMRVWRGAYIGQGNAAYISLEGRDYRNEYLKRGGVRTIRWSIRNVSGGRTASELPSSSNIPVSFFFLE